MEKKIIKNKEVIRWCFNPVTYKSLVNTSNQKILEPYQKMEKDWARSVIGGKGSQWTTKLCENLVQEALVLKGQKMYGLLNINTVILSARHIAQIWNVMILSMR